MKTSAQINTLRLSFLASMLLVPEGKGESRGYEVIVAGERVAKIAKGWSRNGGAGWIVLTPGRAQSGTQRNLNQAKNTIADRLSRAS